MDAGRGAHVTSTCDKVRVVPGGGGVCERDARRVWLTPLFPSVVRFSDDRPRVVEDCSGDSNMSASNPLVSTASVQWLCHQQHANTPPPVSATADDDRPPRTPHPRATPT